MRSRRAAGLSFWTHQGVRIAVTLLLILGVVSIWFEDPTRLATARGSRGSGVVVCSPESNHVSWLDT